MNSKVNSLGSCVFSSSRLLTRRMHWKCDIMVSTTINSVVIIITITTTEQQKMQCKQSDICTQKITHSLLLQKIKTIITMITIHSLTQSQHRFSSHLCIACNTAAAAFKTQRMGIVNYGDLTCPTKNTRHQPNLRITNKDYQELEQSGIPSTS